MTDSISIDPERLYSPSRKELKQEKAMAQIVKIQLTYQ